MTDPSDDDPERKPASLLDTAFRTGVKAISTAQAALRSERLKKLRGGFRNVAGGLVVVTHFMRSNSLKGLLTGEVVLDEKSLNRWFSRVEPPEGVHALSLRLRPSRLVLVMSFERRLLGLPLGHTTVELPFEIAGVNISHRGGTIELHLDREAVPEARGFVRPVLVRLLSRAAADLLEDKSPLEPFDAYGDVVRRHGNLLKIDVGAFPPFVELMNRELRLPGGMSVFPFRAIEIHGARVEEGSLIVSTRLDPDHLSQRTRRLEDDIEQLDAGDESIPVEIATTRPAVSDPDDFFEDP